MEDSQRLVAITLDGTDRNTQAGSHLFETVPLQPVHLESYPILHRQADGYYENKSYERYAGRVKNEYKQLIQNWKDGNYPFGGVPQIDEDGIADMQPMVDAGYIVVATERKFNEDRDYLWPIPAADRLINESLTQNPNW